MLLEATESDYQQVPPGIYDGICIWVIDLGWQDTPYGVKRQLFLNYEIIVDGEHATIGRFFNATLNNDSALAKVLGSWRGKPIKPKDKVDISKVLGHQAQVIVVHNDKGRAVIDNVMPSKSTIVATHALLTEQQCDDLPEWWQAKLADQVREPAKDKPEGMSYAETLAFERERAKKLDDEVPW